MASCTVQRPSPQDLWDRISERFSSLVLGGGDIIPESVEWYALSLNYAMAEEFYAYADQLSRESDPRTACCENLLDIAARWGMYPRPAGFAEGYVLITGSPNAPLTAPMTLTVGNLEYRSTGQVPMELTETGRATVRFRAVEPGPASNHPETTTGDLANAPPGVNAEVSILGGQFCGGTLEETCEEFRSRFISRQAHKPVATRGWLVDKMLEWPCVTRVCDRAGECCETESEGGCDCAACANNTANQFYVLMDDTFPGGAAPACVNKEIENWLFGPEDKRGAGLGQAPIGVCGSIHVFAPAQIDLRIDVNGCASPQQTAEAERRLREYFGTVCPSEEVLIQTLTAIVGQVFGLAMTTQVYAEAVDPGITSDDCGNIIADCDVIPVLGQVIWTGPMQDEYPCYS